MMNIRNTRGWPEVFYTFHDGAFTWLSLGDFIPRGGREMCGKTPCECWNTITQSYFTKSILPVHSSCSFKKQLFCAVEKAMFEFEPSANHPLITYHGTGAEQAASILCQGFIATRGMLGVGVYSGSVWKAVRYAARDSKTYVMRDQGVILRCAITGSFKHVHDTQNEEWECDPSAITILESAQLVMGSISGDRYDPLCRSAICRFN